MVLAVISGLCLCLSGNAFFHQEYRLGVKLLVISGIFGVLAWAVMT